MVPLTGNPPHNGRLKLAFYDDWQFAIRPIRAQSINRFRAYNHASKYAFERSDHGMFISLVFLLIDAIKSTLDNIKVSLQFTSIKSGS
ncbi:MAG: hypothetical protein PHI13_05235 [Methylococcales bacterium]|nr:hypothetical protein [Methylococcales bacterium]